MKQIVAKVMANQYLVIAIVVVILLAVFLYVRYLKKRKYQRAFDEHEIRYNELMSIPVLFKFNKASGLAKVTPEVTEEVQRCKIIYDDLNKRQDELTEMMAEAEDAIAFNKLKTARIHLGDLGDLLGDTLEITHQLDKSLDDLLEQERQQRVEITELKERFRNLKLKMNDNSNLYAESFITLEMRTKEVEHNFSVFEEWMFASNFEKAKELSEENYDLVVALDEHLDRIPPLYEQAKGVIPGMLEQVSKSYQIAKVEDVFVDHLEIAKNIGLITEVLKEDLVRISQCELDDAEESLIETKKRLEQMKQGLDKEQMSHFELKTQSEITFDKLDMMVQLVNDLSTTAESDAVRFNLNSHVAQLAEYHEALNRFKEIEAKIVRMRDEERVPASTILVSMLEMKQDLEVLEAKLQETRSIVSKAKADEIRAQQQLQKLYLIINDVQVRIKQRAIRSISDTYNEDLVRANQYTKQIKTILDDDKIDVTTLNATVSEAIDYIYKLHNNVNNLVGVVDMCENALVYANKFRAYVADIDDDLTRAELAYNNGEYTSALTTIINSIDRYKPNINYEEMILNNAKSAR